MISAEDYIRLRTTTKDTKRPHKIAKKTQTYLDKLRERNVVLSTTTQSSTTLTILKENDEETSRDHPTAHLRPSKEQNDNSKEQSRTAKIGGDRSNIRGVQLVTPVYGEFTPPRTDISSNKKLNSSRSVFATH